MGGEVLDIDTAEPVCAAFGLSAGALVHTTQVFWGSPAFALGLLWSHTHTNMPRLFVCLANPSLSG